MRILLFAGSHPRHLHVHAALLHAFDVSGVVCCAREEMIPEPPPGIPSQDAQNFRRHFADRLAAERRFYAATTAEATFGSVKTYHSAPADMNGPETARFVTSCEPDVVVIFGTGLIKEPLVSALPRDKVNLHLGLSPWYRGAATLFWPFYNLQPQHAGSTIHQIVAKADAGAVIHQTTPPLERGDGIHDVGAKTVLAATDDLLKLLRKRESAGEFEEAPQTSSGRLYRQRDFKPEHLRVIYDLFDNRMVDAFLRGDLSQERPTLIKGV